MRDLNRDQMARHLFDLMNKRERLPYSLEPKIPQPEWPRNLDAYWQFMVDFKYSDGYYRLADYFMTELTKK